MARTKQRARKATATSLKGKKVALASAGQLKKHHATSLQPIVKEEQEEERVGPTGPSAQAGRKKPAAGLLKKKGPAVPTRRGMDISYVKRKFKRGTKALK